MFHESHIPEVFAWMHTNQDQHEKTPKQCRHLGSKRLCCDELYICRETAGMNCVLSGPASEAVRVCDKCELFEGIGDAT